MDFFVRAPKIRYRGSSSETEKTVSIFYINLYSVCRSKSMLSRVIFYFYFYFFEPRRPFHSYQELWDALALNLHLPQQVLENLRKRLLKYEPYVLTHCDLNLGNIMVQDGKDVGILEWEYAAFFPIWYEYVSASFGFTDMDVEWKKLLRERLDAQDEGHESAKRLWTDMCNLRQYPNMHEKGKETLERLS